MNPKIEEIIVKYITKSATTADLDALSDWIKTPANIKMFKDYIQTHYAITFSMNNPESNGAIEELLKSIRKEKSLVYRLKNQSVFRYAAAAVLIGILGTSYFFKDNFFNNNKEITPVIVNTNSIEPGTDKATLTLDDGSVVTLEKGNNYQTQTVNSNGEEIVYEVAERSSAEITYNYLTIPRGGQFHIILSDDTEVWLNSESRLKYPVAFIDGDTRQVELIYGEAYFDVSPSTDHNGAGFKVYHNMQEVQVLGTEFNIKAYNDEINIYTTLVDGKIAIDNGIVVQNLEPSEQSIINIENKDIIIASVDVYDETSWKNGIFSFKSKSLKDIMKVLSRWYDTEVVFLNKDLEDVKFIGVLSKKQKIEDILLTIKNTNFINAYEINNKKITLK
tara:strand:+ start:3375 stop:4544 length:1170 start_codon:yes stop_codon:yes gene_type:complete